MRRPASCYLQCNNPAGGNQDNFCFPFVNPSLSLPAMNLEDNLGDIIRKARAMTNVSVEAAAKAAGLTDAELTALEDSGKISKAPNFSALAQLIGLSAPKLEKIAKGWTPAEPDLSLW